MHTCHPFLMNLEPKIHIFSHIRSLSAIQHAYTQAAPLQPTYVGICARKYKNGVRFPCHDRRSLIPGLPHNGNVLNQTFSCILKTIKAQFRSMEKKEKAFNFERKVTLEKLLYIESASLCPSSLNTVFIPQALSLLSREPHCLSPMIFALVED
jgi:hypothetical protein